MVEAQAVMFVAPRRIELRTIEVHEPADDEVLVATSHSGISAGTEMLAYRGEVDPGLPLDATIGSLGGTFTYPFTYGYSCVGYVERPGGGLDEGTAVFAYHPHQSHFCVQANDVVPIEAVPPRDATLFPLVETALQITLDAGPVFGQTVVVMGLGAVGLLVGALLTRGGARVLGGEPRDWRRAAAPAFGVQAVAPDALTTVVADATGGVGVPLVVEVSGNPAGLASSLALLAHEGMALVASWYGTKPVTLPLGAEFHRRRLSIRSTQVSTIPAHLQDRWTVARRRAVTLDLLSDVPLGALATHSFPVADADFAFSAVDRAETGLLHAALSYA